MSKQKLEEIAEIIDHRSNYTPDPQQIISIINNLELPARVIASRCIKHFHLSIAGENISELKSLNSSTPLGLLLLLYQPQYNQSIELLISKGEKPNSHDLIILIAIAEKITDSILKILLNTYKEELISPTLDEWNIFHFLSLQRFINSTLIDFILSKLDPTVSYNNQKSGIESAKNRKNYPLLHYFYTKGYKVRPEENITPSLIKDNLNNNDVTQNFSEIDFSDAVKQFKQEYHFKSLKKWIPLKEETQVAQNYALFLSNPTIGSFLGRKTVEVNQFTPNYQKNETSFYAGIRTLFKIPFRNEEESLSKEQAIIDQKKPGTTQKTKYFMTQTLKNELPQKNNFLVISFYDVYDLSKQMESLKTIKINGEQYLYIFSLTGKDNHAFFTFSLIDTKTENISFHMIINSWEDSEYIKYLTPRINYEQNYNQSTIAKVFDASISAQTHENDVYCTSYSIEITRSLYSTLHANSDLRQKIEHFSNAQNQEELWDSLKSTIQAEIKISLPMFFSQTSNEFALKPKDDIINWHIQNRFSYGSTFINELRKESEAMIQENQAAIQKMQAQFSE